MLPVKWVFPLLLLVVYPSWAQDSASTRITLTIPNLVQISELRDIDLGEWSGSGDLQAEQQLCVWSSTGNYTLSGNSDNAAVEQFRLAADDSFVDYQVFWDDGSGLRELKQGEKLNNLNGAVQRNCSGEDQTRPHLHVRVTDKRLLEAAPGHYHDLLRLTVSTD